jgi:hypothetical protein
MTNHQIAMTKQRRSGGFVLVLGHWTFVGHCGLVMGYFHAREAV